MKIKKAADSKAMPLAGTKGQAGIREVTNMHKRHQSGWISLRAVGLFVGLT